MIVVWCRSFTASVVCSHSSCFCKNRDPGTIIICSLLCVAFLSTFYLTQGQSQWDGCYKKTLTERCPSKHCLQVIQRYMYMYAGMSGHPGKLKEKPKFNRKIHSKSEIKNKWNIHCKRRYVYRNFQNKSRGLYIDFDQEKVACGLQRAAYTPRYEYWRTMHKTQCTIEPISCLRSTTGHGHHVSIKASWPIAAASLNPCIYTWAIFHHFQIIMQASWNWKI